MAGLEWEALSLHCEDALALQQSSMEELLEQELLEHSCAR
eukprot:CAMPEP_0179161122 /NCGR_PEP_ID=MMETSP0796-20121207/78841_1 /TAXON_ID=73915 /ORGANISM="Pyrodinium bahamense, Strain pbaha01" /LENGTH=39 /DNA_ID= /DNA_START= /DNA_END= /DNA_ORIENTATION=